MRFLFVALAALSLQESNHVVTLSFDDCPVKEAFAELSKQSGLAFEVDERAGRERVTAHLREASPLAAADAICRENGKIRLEFPTYARKILVQPGHAQKGPACDRRDFLFRVTQIIDVRTQNFGESPASGLTVYVLSMWSGDPAALGPLELTEGIDDTGQSLLKSPREKKLGFPKTTLAELAPVTLLHPKEGARKISLKGRREAIFAGETRALRIPVEALPASDGPLTLVKMVREETGLTALLEFARDGERRIAGPDRFKDLAFVDSDGKRHSATVTTAATGPEKVKFEVMVKSLPKNATLVALETVYVVKYTNRSIEFEFKDMELP